MLFSTQTMNVEWKMGTGSEPAQMPNPRKNAVGSLPVPFFHGNREEGVRR